MNIVVAHAADESVHPPKGRRPARKTDVQEVAHVLRGAGHDVSGIAVDGTPECLRALTQVRPDLIFNLVESFGDDNSKEPHVAAYYDLLGLRYTGSSPRGLTLAMDKAAKKILGFHNVASPKFAVFWRGRLDFDADDIAFPVIVKPLREDGSIGIGFDALAGNIKELMERIDGLTGEFNCPILIEQYIEGREIYMGVLGNSPPEALPPVELDLSHLPKGTPRIAGTEVKWSEGTRVPRQQGAHPEAAQGRPRDHGALRAHRLPGTGPARLRARRLPPRPGGSLPDRGQPQPVSALGRRVHPGRARLGTHAPRHDHRDPRARPGAVQPARALS
jgi:D-alanine-D-alanine ligase-like ATP-grasp enzyme